jgi:hypothetical protein
VARRNRLRACNLERRNLTKGQQTMTLAMIYPEEPEKGRGRRLGFLGWCRRRLANFYGQLMCRISDATALCTRRSRS